MNYEITLIDSIEKLETFVPQWLAFLETMPLGASVYNHPHHILAHIRHRSEEMPNRQLVIVVVRESGNIVCIAPLLVQDKVYELKLSIKPLFSFKIRQMICHGGSFVYQNQPQNVADYFRNVFNTLKRSVVRFDLFIITGLRNNSPFWDYCQTQLTGKPFRLFNVLAEKQHDLLVHLPDSMDKLLASIDKKKRKNVRRDLEHFQKSVNNFRLERITDASQVEIFFDNVMKISANSWQGKTFGLTDWKSESRLRCWKEIAEKGWLRSYILWADDKPVAYRISYQYNGVCYGQTPGYDLAAADLAPGIVLLYYCLDDLMQYQPVKVFDFDFGTLGNKRIFANEEIESMTVFIAGSKKGTLLAFLQTFLNKFVFAAKKILHKWGLTDRVRKMLKHK